MNVKFLTILFMIGIALGFLYTFTTMHPTPTGAATCFLNNEPCDCENQTCICGFAIVPTKHCLEQPPSP